MEAAYAQALFAMVADGKDPKVAVHAIAQKLERDGRTSLLPRVARAFARIAEREAKRNNLVLTVARESDVSDAKKATREIAEDLGVDHGSIQTEIDDSLIGGWKIEGKETLIDASYKQQLMDLYSRVTRA